METRYLSTATVARALGVSVTTVKRWVDGGVLSAHKTAGGHRKILLADVLRLVRQDAMPCADLSLLTGALPSLVGRPIQELAEDLFTALHEGNPCKTHAVVLHAQRSGLSLAELADSVIAPAMRRVGQCWETDALDVYQEHRAPQLLLTVLQDLRRRQVEVFDASQPLALGGCPEGDSYLLATLLAELTLRDSGWRTSNIGPNTPLVSLIRAMTDLKPQLVWLSVSHLASPKKFLCHFAELATAARTAGVTLVVGGNALTEEVRRALPESCHGVGMVQLAELAQTLQLPPMPAATAEMSRSKGEFHPAKGLKGPFDRARLVRTANSPCQRPPDWATIACTGALAAEPFTLPGSPDSGFRLHGRYSQVPGLRGETAAASGVRRQAYQVLRAAAPPSACPPQSSRKCPWSARWSLNQKSRSLPPLPNARRGHRRSRSDGGRRLLKTTRSWKTPPNFKPCPRCGTKRPQRVTWTAWGSFYGPALFNHVRCRRCGYAYNGRTGGSNMVPAIIFVSVCTLGILGILGFVGWMIYARYFLPS